MLGHSNTSTTLGSTQNTAEVQNMATPQDEDSLALEAQSQSSSTSPTSSQTGKQSKASVPSTEEEKSSFKRAYGCFVTLSNDGMTYSCSLPPASPKSGCLQEVAASRLH